MKDQLTKQLRRDEGVIDHAYTDSLGYWTIGVGRLIDQRKGGKLSDDEIDFLLSNDIDRHAEELFKLAPWIKNLDEARQGALVNMAFNLGVAGLLGFKNTLSLIQGGKYDDAAKAMLESKWSHQVGKRADRLAEQIRTGVWM